ncbi:MAG: hypothetical protein ACJAYN_000843 [Bermanella sp.]|jgi:hypothetical protein|nr:DUF2066 domain-containing protein [Glaciecola sp. 33A]
MQKRSKYLTIASERFKDSLVLNKLLAIIVFTLCLVTSMRCHSTPIDHLNKGQIIVTDQSSFTQKIAGKRAFQQVVVKLSGDVAALENLQVKRSVTNFEQYLVASTFIQDGDKLLYQAEFNEQKVVNLLRSESLNVWGKRRPSGLFWLAIEDDVSKNKTLITQSSTSIYLDTIRQATYDRGVELLMPIGDLTDSMNITVLDVWGLFSSSIFNKSTRYGTNYVIGARVGVVFDDFSARETLQLSYFITNGQTIETNKIVGDDIAVLIAEFVNEYATYLANLYSIEASESGQIYSLSLNIANVNTLIKYRKVLEILSSLTVTQTVELSAQSKDVASFILASNVPLERLKTILKLEQNLREPEYQRLDSAVAIDYEWRGK